MAGVSENRELGNMCVRACLCLCAWIWWLRCASACWMIIVAEYFLC